MSNSEYLLRYQGFNFVSLFQLLVYDITASLIAKKRIKIETLTTSETYQIVEHFLLQTSIILTSLSNPRKPYLGLTCL